MAFKIGNSEVLYQQVNKGSASNNQLAIGDAALTRPNDTAVQTVMRTTGNTVNRFIESAGDIITVPAVWLKDIQENWLSYMIVAAIILFSIAFLYCACCSFFNWKKNNGSSNNLLELAKVISNKNGTLQQPLPLPAPNSPSIAPNLSV